MCSVYTVGPVLWRMAEPLRSAINGCSRISSPKGASSSLPAVKFQYLRPRRMDFISKGLLINEHIICLQTPKRLEVTG